RWVVDRNACARRVRTLLVRIAVDRVVKKVGSYPAVVQQRVALARRAVADDRSAGVLRVNEELEQLALRCFHLRAEPGVRLEVAITRLDFAPLEFRDALRGRESRCSGMA